MSTHVRKTTHVKKEVPGNKIIIPGTSAFYCRNSGLLKGDGNHVYRTWYNQTHAYRHLNLKVVYGSLGFGKEGEEEIFYELGGVERTTFPQFINEKTYDRNNGMVWAVDLYSWLEDENGRIYDIFESEWDIRASDLPRWISMTKWGEIRGKTIEEMKQNHGIHYVKAANPDTQFLIEMFMERHFRPQYEQFLRENPRLPV